MQESRVRRVASAGLGVIVVTAWAVAPPVSADGGASVVARAPRSTSQVCQSTVAAAGPNASRAAVPPGPDNGVPSNVGTNFWTAFGANISQTGVSQDNCLFIIGTKATTATVAVPGAQPPFSVNVAVTPGRTALVSMPSSQTSLTTPDGFENLGVHVTAGAPVSVYGFEDQQYVSGGFTALPATAIGSDYYTLGYESLPGSPPETAPSDFQIVGTETGTKVTIVTRVHSALGPPGTDDETIGVGRVFELIGESGDDLTGTHITSTAPVSVLAGAQCASIPNGNYDYCNYVAQQMPPTSEWGTEFLTEPLATRTAGDTWRVLSGSADTIVDINGTQVATLGAGQFFQTQLTSASVIRTSEPVLVAQYADSGTFDNTTGDPSELLDPPSQQFFDSYSVATATDARFKNWLNVVAPASAVDSIRLNGKDVSTLDFVPIGSSGWSGAQLPVAPGTYTLSAPQAFGVSVYGWDVDDAYSYPGGYLAAPIASAAYLSVKASSAFVVIGGRTCVTATVENKQHGPLAGMGVDFAVSGPNAAHGFAVTGSDGAAIFCFVGGSRGVDPIVATAASLEASTSVEIGLGYRLEGGDGGVFAFSEPFYGSVPPPDPPGLGLHLYDFAGMVAGAGGYWLAERNGGVFAFGAAGYYGSLTKLGIHVDDIVGIAATPDGKGYWLASATGDIYAFGDASSRLGSLAGKGVTDIVGILATTSGAGYWLVAGNGAVYGFGNAAYDGSCASAGSGCHGVTDVVGMASAGPGGYWLVTQDGDVFAFGDVVVHGSCAQASTGCHSVDDVVGMASPGAGGYWIAEADGNVIPFGAVTSLGRCGATGTNCNPLARPIVAITSGAP
jgi:hypothetical protein